jgi:hypothetical protein
MRKNSPAWRRWPRGMAVVSLVLLSLLPTKRLFADETNGPRDRIEETRDIADTVALVGSPQYPEGSEEAASPFPQSGAPSYKSATVITHSYRGPPARS